MTDSPATGFPRTTRELEAFGLKSSDGGAHISRTMMLAELEQVLASVLRGASVVRYRDAILVRNVLGETTSSTRDKSLRHLRELYSLDESTPIFGALRCLHLIEAGGLPPLTFQMASGRARHSAPPRRRFSRPPMAIWSRRRASRRYRRRST